MSGGGLFWQPEIGQRVRIRLSAECPLHAAMKISTDGLVGYVNADIESPDSPVRESKPGAIARALRAGHRWWVVFDRPFGVNAEGKPLQADPFAATELGPVND